MIIEDTIVQILSSGAQRLKGSEKRRYMADTVQLLGRGAQRACEQQLGWCRNTIRKGWHELQSGINCIDNFGARGRKRSEEKNPKLIEHIREIVEASSQADPSMQSVRIYVKMTCNQIRLQLKKRFQYDEEDIPLKGSIRRILNDNQYHLRKVRKTLPKKR